MAQALDVCIRYSYQIGEFVNENAILCYIWDAKTDADDYDDDDGMALEQRIIELIRDEDDHESSVEDKSLEYRVERRLGLLASKGIVISKLRTSNLDITLGIQQLSDIAVRALSQ